VPRVERKCTCPLVSGNGFVRDGTLLDIMATDKGMTRFEDSALFLWPIKTGAVSDLDFLKLSLNDSDGLLASVVSLG